MVVLIEKKLTLKIAILATLTLLTLSGVSALTWESPDSPVTGTVTLNVSVDSANQGNTVSFDYREDGGDWQSIDDNVDSTSGYASVEWSTGDPGSGDYTVRANVTDGPEETRSITVDNGKPSIDIPVDNNARLNSDSVNFEITASDGHTDLNDLEVIVEDSEGDEIYSETEDCDGQECTFSPDFESDLDHNSEYTIEATTSDQVGLSDTEDIDFTYDDEYEGDEEPRINPEPQVFATPENKDEYTFDIVLEEQDPAEPSDITVTCKLGGRDAVEADTQDVDGTTSYECDVEPMRDTQTTLEVVLKDEAGNSVTKEYEYTFDYSKPSVNGLSTVVSVFNTDFEVDYEASDSASDITELVYRFDESTLDTDSNGVEADGSFDVDTSGLDAGDHTLYVWAKDEAGRWSSDANLTFEFRPDATPSAQVTGLEELSVTAGSSKTFNIWVKNTGDLLIPSLTFELDTGFSNHTSIVSNLKPGDNRSTSFTVETSDSNLGRHNVRLSSKSPDVSRQFDLIVEANSDQEENISERFDREFSEFEGLRSNVSELMSRVSGDRQKKLEEEFSDINETMAEAQRAIQEGDYYRAASLMENVDSQYSKASEGYEQVRQEHSKAQRNKFVFGFLLLLVIGGGGTVGYFYMNEDYVFDFSAIEDLQFGGIDLSDYEFSMEPVENLFDRFRDFVEEEEEKAEEAFTGFT
ncbi:hypothetical protein [Candidatus Nanohalovita haloferacivicina]|uniref:COG1470 family protein n=1 Tax=Candidatus Nanohalovita haloferacivicina TaxID=2978046 RepID=UPI00325FDBA1|nr:hypothetical protein HBNXNv_0899 [Candidatus Nanohalobia archaeon BNXNv]